MPISKITKTSRGRDAIAYALEGHGHDGSEMRNVEIGCVNLDPHRDFGDQMQMYWDKAIHRHKIQVMRVIQSFALEELNPNDPNDLLKANMIGQDFASKYYPDRQAVVFTQIDGKGGKVHNHIIISDVHMLTFKGHTDEQGHYASVEKWTDEIASQYIANMRNPRKENEKTNDKKTQTERAKNEAGKFVWKDSLKTRIIGAMDACSDEKSFMSELLKRGVTAVKRESKKYGTYFTYTLDKKYIPRGEKMPKNLSARSYNLGEDYGYDAMRRHFRTKTKVVGTGDSKYERVYLKEETPEVRPDVLQMQAMMTEESDSGYESVNVREEIIPERDTSAGSAAEYIPPEEVIPKGVVIEEPVEQIIPDEEIPTVETDVEKVHIPEETVQDEMTEQVAESRPVKVGRYL